MKNQAYFNALKQLEVQAFSLNEAMPLLKAAGLDLSGSDLDHRFKAIFKDHGLGDLLP